MTFNIPLEQIDDNPWQTRQTYTDLEDLAEDIHQNGLLQPPVVRMNTDWAEIRYELAFGHRRFRAWKLLHEKYGAAYAEFPTELRELTDEQMADFAWSENEKRRDVSPIERMHAIQKQMADFGWSQAEIARRRGLNTATVSNILRLAQLPAELQTKVHTGEMSERQAISLLPYYALPETVRTAASKKTWISDPVKYAEQGKSSDDIRNAVQSVIRHTSVALEHFPLDQVFEGAGILSPTCVACPNHFVYNRTPYCGEQTRTCFKRKKANLCEQQLQEAHQTSGLPIKGVDERVTQSFSWSSNGYSLRPTESHPGLLAQGCEHLRLQNESYISPSEALDLQLYPSVRVICCNPDNQCTCAKAMSAAHQKAQQVDPQEAARLKAQAEEQARKDHLLTTFTTQLVIPTQRALLDSLHANDLRVWQLILDGLTNIDWKEIAQWDLETCQTKIAKRLVPANEWTITRDTEDALARLNRMRAKLGLEPLELPEDEHANPAEKLEHKLQRIEGWWEDAEDYPPDYEAVEGNVTNLDNLYALVDKLTPLSDNTLIARIVNLRDGLQAWLDEADANQDPEEDEEEFA